MECVLYAVGSPFVAVARDAIDRLGWTIRGGVVNVEGALVPKGLELVDAGEIPPDWLELPVVLPLMTPGHRFALGREAIDLGFRSFATLVDPTAIVSSNATVREGTTIVAGAVVGPEARLGRLVVVNRAASVGHDVSLADYSSLAPGCVLCGGVLVERGAFVGAGATVNPEISIGANAVVASGAVVISDVAPHTLVAGNPARMVREQVPGYNGVTVPPEEARSA